MRYLKIIQLLVSFLLLFLILREISIGELKDSLANVLENKWYFIAAICTPAIGFLASSVRLKLILSVQDISIPLRRLVAINLIGAFYNQVLPSTIGGDVVRIIMLGKVQVSSAQNPHRAFTSVLAIASIGADRALGIIGILITGAVALFLNPMLFDLLKRFDLMKLLIYGAGALLCAAVTGCIILALIKKSENRYVKAVLEKAGFTLRKLSEIVRNKKYLLYTIILSIVIQLAVVFEFYILSMALALKIKAFDLAVIIPVVDLISMLPISIGGIGLRENTLLFMGAPMGLTPSISVLLSYFYLGIKILWALVGGFLYVKEQAMSSLK